MLTTEYIWQKCKNKPHILNFFPDGIKCAYIKREFLFNVIHHTDKEFYMSLLKEKHAEEKKKQKPTFANLTIKISNKYKDKLKTFDKLTGKIKHLKF